VHPQWSVSLPVRAAQTTNNNTKLLLQIVIFQQTQNRIRLQWAVLWKVVNCHSVDVGVGSRGTHGTSSFSVNLHCVFSGREKSNLTVGYPIIKAPWWSLPTCTIFLSHFTSYD
jgi:hypothetical protein